MAEEIVMIFPEGPKAPWCSRTKKFSVTKLASGSVEIKYIVSPST